MIGRTVRHYRIVEKLGEGGMGAVYKAEDTTLNRLVALKTLSSHLSEDDEAKERFIREARAASALNHPNITTIYELLEEDDNHFISMEYVEGKTIQDILESGQVSIKKAINIVLQAAEALDAAHRKEILHRDVKSANIMVSMEGNVKVMDFGLAQLKGANKLTRTGTTMGTLAYSSPEQLTGRPYDERCEIWSLGVVLYELLTGKLPFKSRSEGELVFEIINNEQERPSAVREDMPASVESVVMRMLEKDPEHRYQNCGELIAELNAIGKELETTPLRMATVSQFSLTRLKKRSRPIATGALAAVFTFLAIYFLVLAPEPKGPVRIAVIPFQNLGASEFDSWVSGLAVVINNQLQTLSGLQVQAYRGPDLYDYSNRSYRQIGGDLGADYLLWATVQREIVQDGSTLVRLNPQLIRVSDESTIPVEALERTLSGLLELQTDLAVQVSHALNVALLAKEREAITANYTENDIAYDYFMRGRDYYSQIGQSELQNESAVQMFERAVGLDSTFALAWAYLSRAQVNLGDSWYWTRMDGSDIEVMQKGLESAERALRLNPDLEEAHLARGYYLYRVEEDHESALIEFQEVLEGNPDNVDALRYTATVHRYLGKWDTSYSNTKRAVELDPLNVDLMRSHAFTCIFLRLYPEAERFLIDAKGLSPEVRQIYREMAILYLLWHGDREKAWKVLDDAPGEVLRRIVATGGSTNEYRMMYRVLAPHFSVLVEQVPPLYGDQNYYLSRAEVALGIEDIQLAGVYFDSVRINTEKTLSDIRGGSFKAQTLSEVGKAYAFLGLGEDAVRSGEEAVSETPVSQNALYGARIEATLAEIYTMVGEEELAIDQLEHLLSIEALISVPLLRIDPIWDPLRDNPRFQALIER